MKLFAFSIVSTIAAVQGRILANDPPCPPEGCGLCEASFDCDKQADCKYGLLCADEHKAQLKTLKLDPRTANCPAGIPKADNTEFCFDPCSIDDFKLPKGYECVCTAQKMMKV